MDVNQIIDKIYSYYPKNCNPFSVDYDLAQETKNRKLEIRKRRAVIQSKWAQFVETLKRRYSTTAISDETEIFDAGFCNYLTYNSRIAKTTLKYHVMLSLLVPCHNILISSLSDSDQKQFITCEPEDLERYLTIYQMSLVLGEVDYMNSELVKIFHTDRIIRAYFEKIIVPNIALQSKKEGEVTLFDCVFTDHILTY